MVTTRGGEYDLGLIGLSHLFFMLRYRVDRGSCGWQLSFGCRPCFKPVFTTSGVQLPGVPHGRRNGLYPASCHYLCAYIPSSCSARARRRLFLSNIEIEVGRVEKDVRAYT